jgi:LmbE family N-acetylglucosaminyl deacetylase
MRAAPFLLLLVILATAAPAAAQRTRAARIPDFSRLLVITAHPDDESLFSPLLGARCGVVADCTLLVMTRGENGPCVLAGGCGPDLAATRTNELNAAAALLHAKLVLWTLPDVMNDVIAQWGGHDALLARIAQAVDDVNPTAILTLDPTHGTTCHPAHRTLGAIVAEAAGERHVFFIETRASLDGERYVLFPAIDHASPLYRFDVASSWHFFADDMRAHASQFSETAVESVAETADKMILMIPSNATASYVAPCE